MSLPNKPGPTRLPHHIFTAILLVQLVLPLFFSLQIVLIWAGADSLTVSPARVRAVVLETPPLAIIAPMLRVGLIAAMLYTHYRHPSWTLRLLVFSFVIHVIGWMSIINNPYFDAPTGYVTLALQLTLLVLLVLNPDLQKRRI